MWALVAELEAAKADMIAMHTTNTERINDGRQIAYSEKAFCDLRNIFMDISKRMREL